MKKIIYDNYQIDEYGNVYSLIRKKYMKQQLDRYGYRYITLYIGKKAIKKKIHRLVALAFIGESDLCVDHIDRDKENNYYKI